MRCLFHVLLGAAVVATPITATATPLADGLEHTIVDHGAQRAHVSGLAARDDVARQLQELGISRDEAQRRIAALSDDEVASLDGKLATLPAGGDSSVTIGVGSAIIIALLLIIFL